MVADLTDTDRVEALHALLQQERALADRLAFALTQACNLLRSLEQTNEADCFEGYLAEHRAMRETPASEA